MMRYLPWLIIAGALLAFLGVTPLVPEDVDGRIILAVAVCLFLVPFAAAYILVKREPRPQKRRLANKPARRRSNKWRA